MIGSGDAGAAVVGRIASKEESCRLQLEGSGNIAGVVGVVGCRERCVSTAAHGVEECEYWLVTEDDARRIRTSATQRSRPSRRRG